LNRRAQRDSSNKYQFACSKWNANQAIFVAGQFHLGGSFPSLIGPNAGWFSSIDVTSRVFNWRDHLDLLANGGALVMNYTSLRPGVSAKMTFFSSAGRPHVQPDRP
jgi:hypothetical protein